MYNIAWQIIGSGRKDANLERNFSCRHRLKGSISRTCPWPDEWRNLLLLVSSNIGSNFNIIYKRDIMPTYVVSRRSWSCFANWGEIGSLNSDWCGNFWRVVNDQFQLYFAEWSREVMVHSMGTFHKPWYRALASGTEINEIDRKEMALNRRKRTKPIYFNCT